jgi:nicotinate-nucleotide pyrophosphorylase (carboxylating)
MELNKEILKEFVQNALKEDVAGGDHTSLATIPAGARGKARLIIKEEGILAGAEVARFIFSEVDPKLQTEVLISDGSEVRPGDIAMVVSGSQYSILVAERLVLNIMQRMSGIATITRRITGSLKETRTRVLDTRKTTPNLRYFEKLAVKIGGGINHRFGLYDMILIKDNHVDYAGGIPQALQATRSYLEERGLKIPVEIEVRSLEELQQVLEIGGVDRILLDNFDYETLRKAVNIVDGRVPTEASGGITEENAIEYARCGVDYVSMGALTHSVKSLDMSLKAIKGG